MTLLDREKNQLSSDMQGTVKMRLQQKYTQLQKKLECFKIRIVSRKRLKLKLKCPRYDYNAPELYLLTKLRMLIDF